MRGGSPDRPPTPPHTAHRTPRALTRTLGKARGRCAPSDARAISSLQSGQASVLLPCSHATRTRAGGEERSVAKGGCREVTLRARRGDGRETRDGRNPRNRRPRRQPPTPQPLRRCPQPPTSSAISYLLISPILRSLECFSLTRNNNSLLTPWHSTNPALDALDNYVARLPPPHLHPPLVRRPARAPLVEPTRSPTHSIRFPAPAQLAPARPPLAPLPPAGQLDRQGRRRARPRAAGLTVRQPEAGQPREGRRQGIPAWAVAWPASRPRRAVGEPTPGRE